MWQTASSKTPSLIAYINGISLLTDPRIQSTLYDKIKNLTSQLPDPLRNTSADEDAALVHQAAYKVLFQLPGKESEKAVLLASLITPNGPYLELARKVIDSKSDAVLKESYARLLTEKIQSFSKDTPESQRFEPIYNQTLALGKRLAGLLPAQTSATMIKNLENASTIEVTISAIPAQMLFDKNELNLQAGRRVSLEFKNPDLMPHNIVFVKPGTEDKVGTAADAMATSANGFEKNFVPDLADVLFATPLVNAGASTKLNFTVPSTPGDYPYICSFPGHWRVMRGIMKVR